MSVDSQSLSIVRRKDINGDPELRVQVIQSTTQESKEMDMNYGILLNPSWDEVSYPLMVIDDDRSRGQDRSERWVG